LGQTINPNEQTPGVVPRVERRARKRAGPWVRGYFDMKFRADPSVRGPREERRGLIRLQIDALAHADLRRALDMGYCPTIARLLQKEGFAIRRWFCGLPSATPYCQAGIFHGENGGIPAFRFYDKAARRVITCNAPHGVQYIRDRIHSPGALAGGSSYVNLLDGDAQTVAFTVATRERLSVYQRLGGTRMGLLIAIHPLRVARMAVQAVQEWLLEEWERFRGELARRATHSEGIFPFIRILSNVVVRELQTMAIMLDIYLGVPIIYSTFMQYDELGHHFGPSSRQALSDLRRTDARINEIWRMALATSSRRYDLILLSDHGMTPSVSYRVKFGETLGHTVRRILEGGAISIGGKPLEAHMSFAEDTEYADMGPQVVEAVAQVAPPPSNRRRLLLRMRDWLRSRYGLREIILPEKYLVSRSQDIVVTYSSCLALVYFADDERRLELPDVIRDKRRANLYAMLLGHPGIGLVATRLGKGIHVESRAGRATIAEGVVTVTAGENPLDIYGTESFVVRSVHDLVMQPNAGDLVLFGAYDGYDIVSFDDQVGAHGSAGGDQVYPFLITPADLEIANSRIEDARDIHDEVLLRYVNQPVPPRSSAPTPPAPVASHA
jgi:hypothetical protein